MAVYGPYAFCDKGDVERLLSAEGVRLRLDDDGDGAVNEDEEEDILNDCVSEATETVLYYCWAKYDPSVLALNPWVNRVASHFAAYALCRVRGNPVPEPMVNYLLEVEKKLKEVRDGNGLVPRAPLLRRLAPRVSNARVVPGYTFRVLRVDPNSSSRPEGYAQQPDWQSAFTFEI